MLKFTAFSRKPEAIEAAQITQGDIDFVENTLGGSVDVQAGVWLIRRRNSDGSVYIERMPDDEFTRLYERAPECRG